MCDYGRMPAVNATVARVATASANATTLLAAADGKGFCIFNEVAQILYVKFGTGASSTDYTVQLPASTGYYESPPGLSYQGPITARLASSSGFAQVTTLT